MAKKKRTRGRGKKKVVKTRRGRIGLSAVSVGALQAELDRRMAKLDTRRNELLGELEAIDEELAGFGAAPAKRGPGRPAGRKKTVGRKKKVATGGKKTVVRKRAKNKMNLVDALQKTLKGKTLGVTEMSAAVRKAGYKTKSPNFRTIVNQTLIKNPKVFKRVSRGQYTAK